MERTGAVVVLGVMFGGRYPRLVPAATARGLSVLGIDTRGFSAARTDAARAAYPDHPLAGVLEIAWIAGDRHEEVLDRVLAWHRTYDIRAVLAFGEGYVEAAAVVADCLGLRGPGLRASRVCRNKALQRRYLGEFSPASMLVTEDRDRDAAAWTMFPAIVKPVGREASSGVRRVTEAAGLRAALEGYQPSEPVLVEELVSGPEISVESLVADGEVIFAAPTGKRTNETGGEFFVEMAHTVPDPRLSQVTAARVLEANRRILSRLAFRDGIAHAEYRIASDGRPVLMEIAARAAGDCILALYHLATGAPMEEAVLALALGEPVDYPPPRRYARQVYLPHIPGVLRAVRAEGLGAPVTWLSERWMWPAIHPYGRGEPGGVRMVVSGRDPGAHLHPIRESPDRAVMFVIDAPTIAELDRWEQACLDAITIEVEAPSTVAA